MGAKEEQIEAHNNQFRFLTILEPEELIEVFEVLCDIPNEDTMMGDTEPRTTRHPVIERMIEELSTRIQHDEHRNNPEMELYDYEMIREKIAKKRLDEIMDESTGGD